MILQADNLEVRVAAFSRTRIRGGLRQLQQRGLPIGWFERKGWWRNSFIVWGHPAVIRRLKQVLGPTATMHPSIPRGGNLDIAA